MREIKFRAWHEYGGGNANGRFPGMIYDEKPGDCLVWSNQGQKILVIMQYTGLHDRNGKEIWEGDIVKMCPERGNFQPEFWRKCVVKWFAPCFRPTVGGKIPAWGFLDSKWMEVIGNIYENPELMQTTQ